VDIDNYNLNIKDNKLLKVYSNESEHISRIGQILASPLSREIYTVLIEKELNAKELAKIVCDEDTIRLPNVISILNKMLKAGLVIRQKKRQKRTGHPLSFYKSVPIILIVPPNTVEKIIDSKTLKNMFSKFLSKS